MQGSSIIILLALLTLVRVIVEKGAEFIWNTPFFSKRNKVRIIRTLDVKPFNCADCLSFWVGLTCAVIALNPIYFTLYIVNQLYIRALSSY